MIKKRIVLDFPHQLTDKPITYQLVKNYGVEVNILRAKISPDEEGRMMVEMKAPKAKLQAAINFLKSLDIKITSLARDIMFKEEVCVHCTYCVALCPVEALEVEHSQMKVLFNKEACILCEQCVKVCPYKAVQIKF